MQQPPCCMCFIYFCNRGQITNNSEMAVQFSFSSDEVLELNPGPPKQYYHLASSLFQYTIGYTDASCTVASTRAWFRCKNFTSKNIISNVAALAWKIKYRRNKKLITQFACNYETNLMNLIRSWLDTKLLQYKRSNGLINLSRCLQTNYIIYFVIYSCLIFQMYPKISDVILYTKNFTHLN